MKKPSNRPNGSFGFGKQYGEFHSQEWISEDIPPSQSEQPEGESSNFPSKDILNTGDKLREGKKSPAVNQTTSSEESAVQKPISKIQYHPKKRIRCKKIAFVSSFPPRRCGIAAFTSDLIKNVQAAAGSGFEPLVTAMHASGNLQYPDPVKFEIRRNVKNDYISAADYINFSEVDLVSVQHEFGLFGGEAGSYLNLLLRGINAPIITTLHNILEEPDEHHYHSIIDVCDLSRKVVVMNECGTKLLQKIYDVSPEKIELIPHGVPDLPFVDSSYYKHKFGMDGRRTILTFGLLNRNKGIETMLHALPAIVKADPTVLYIILGTTHPDVIRHDGEEYRFSLQRIVKQLGLENNVIFHNQFVNDEKLSNFFCAADFYVTPYVNCEQLTSGTLAFAVGTGKAVISTPYWAAEELLADGRGKIVGFNSPDRLAEAMIELINDDSKFYSLRRKAYDYGRNITWPQIGRQYWKMFSTKRLPVYVGVTPAKAAEDAVSILDLPEPSLDHLCRLTDDTGLYNSAEFTMPLRSHGYHTIDNAMAVVAALNYSSQYTEPKALQLFDIYLSFICQAQKENGVVRNIMHFDRHWPERESDHDALGNVLWAFGTVMAKPPVPRYLPMIKSRFDRSIKHVPGLSMRSKAYSILGMVEYLKQFPGASDLKRYLAIAVDDITAQYESNNRPDWQWFEEKLTYDNAVLPHALYAAALATGNERYFEIATKTSAFLLDNIFNGEHFSFIGNKGWHKKDRQKAVFDQSPLEAASTIMMLGIAYEATSNSSFLNLQRKAFDWFLGENDLHIPVYDFRTKGCSDGLTPSGVNFNQSGESIVSFILSLLSIIDKSALNHSSGDEQNLFSNKGTRITEEENSARKIQKEKPKTHSPKLQK